MTEPRYNPILHYTALLTTAATLVLIFVGGLVTSHGAGMSVPDWPNSFGYNMWLYPPSHWWNGGGIFYEHSHRLLATLIGFFAIVQVCVAGRYEPRRWALWVHIGVLALVIFQGVLGGLRVIWVDLNLAVVHGITAQIFFCFAAFAAVISSRWWYAARTNDNAAGRGLIRVAGVALLLVLVQLTLGSVMRHYQAGMAIPDLPLAYGKVLPPMSAGDLADANKQRAFIYHMDPVSLGQTSLAFSHRVGAILVSAGVVWLLVVVFRRFSNEPKLFRPAIALAALLLVQLTLGIVTVLKNKPADIASLHVACGALLMMTTFVLWVRSARLFWVADRPAVRDNQSCRTQQAVYAH